MSTDDVLKRNMNAEPVDTGREEVVFGSGVQSDDRRGEYLEISLRARTISTPSILAYAEVNLQRKCKKWFCATQQLSRGMWLVLTFCRSVF